MIVGLLPISITIFPYHIILFTMAQQSNYYDAALLAFQGPVKSEFNKAELRELPEQMLYYGLENQEFIMGVSQISKIKESVNRPVYAYVKVRKPSTNGTAMTAFNTGIGGTAAQQAITWVCFTEEFYINETEAMDNALFPGDNKYALFQNEMSQAQRNLRERIYTWLITNVYNARTNATYNGNTALPLATLNQTYATWEISGNAAATPWAAMTSTMRTNKFGYSGYDVFADSTLHANYEFQQAQTANNATNLAYQLTNTPVTPNKSGRLTSIYEDVLLGQAGGVPYVGGYSNGGALCLPANSFAFIPWMPKIYMDGSGNYEDYAGGYGTVADEVMPGMEYMVHGWRTQADTTLSSGHGYTQDSVTQWQVGYYIAYITQYMSNTNETPIYFFGLKP